MKSPTKLCATLQKVLPKKLLNDLVQMSGNGHGPLPELLAKALGIGLETLSKANHAGNHQVLPAPLSDRQVAVLDCLREGYAVGEIAEHLGISETTVRTHINRIKQRLGCHDLLELRIPARSHSEIGDQPVTQV